jgi:hypothetical protein
MAIVCMAQVKRSGTELAAMVGIYLTNSDPASIRSAGPDPRLPDPDGHIWEVLYMDPASIQQSPLGDLDSRPNPSRLAKM